jgi:hypothetical protein
VVSFTPRPLYPRGKSPRNPLDRSLCEPQSRSGRRGEEKFLTLQRLELQPFRHPAHSQSLYRLSYPSSVIGIVRCKNRSPEICFRDYATVDEAVFSPRRAELCRGVTSRPPRLATLVALQQPPLLCVSERKNTCNDCDSPD